MVHLQKQGAIALHNERLFFGIHITLISSRSPRLGAGMERPRLGVPSIPAWAKSNSLMELCVNSTEGNSEKSDRDFLKTFGFWKFPTPEPTPPTRGHGATLLHPGT